MDTLLPVVLVGIPLAWLVAFAAYAYLDAPNHGMNPRKWAAISFFVPLFGFFAYLFERDERDYDPTADPYAAGDGAFAIHESRRGEGPLGPSGTPGKEDDGHDVGDTEEAAPRNDRSDDDAERVGIGEERNEPPDL